MKLKPSLTYDEQVDHLINEHNLTISNKENAKKILATVNYYRLSGYGIGLTVDKERKKERNIWMELPSKTSLSFIVSTVNLRTV